MFTLLLTVSILNTSVIHPFLNEKLATLKNGEMIDIVVHMKNQADLSKFPNKFSKNDKINYLKEFAESNQKDLLDYLANFSSQVSELKSYWIFNGLALKTTKDIISSLSAREDVAYITYDFKFVLKNDSLLETGILHSPEWNIQKIKADSCWSEGYDGSGVIIGNIDTGVDTTHPALQGKWYPGGWYDAVNGLPGPYDDHGHGTFTMGIICGGDGNGPFTDDIGVAPGVKFIVAKAFDSLGSAPYSVIHSCLQWFATQNARVINNPYNEGETTSLEFWNDCLNLRNLGIFLVLKGGALSTGEMRTPGNFPTVIGIGATDSLDDITWYSGRGPAPNQSPWNDPSYWYRSDWNLIKPDIAAPGQNIRSSWPGGGYEIGNGTSWAASHVTGACAILLQKDSTLTPTNLYNLLLDNADQPPQGGPYPNNEYGWGRLNIYAALNALKITEQTTKNMPLQLAIYPNPFNKSVDIICKINNPNSAHNRRLCSFNIYDVTGRVVIRFNNIVVSQISNKITWNGTDFNGNKLPPGVYFIEANLQNEKIAKKIILLGW
jgi:bacillopeptidase F